MFKRLLFFVSILMFGIVPAKAQFLSGNSGNSPSVFAEQKTLSKARLKDDVRATVSATRAQEAQKRLQDDEDALTPFDYEEDYEAKNLPKEIKPVISRDKNNNRIYDELLLVSMKDFNVYRGLSGQVRCSARFFVVSTYKDVVSNVSYQLKWPNMSTRLSFSKIKPNIQYYYDYLLIGDGCYTMDKAPNVIVNRCRVKGKTQQECAATVRWATRGI